MEMLSRRNFLKTALAVPVGIGIGTARQPVSKVAAEKTKDWTGHPAGNASLAALAEQECAPKPNPEKCKHDFELSTYEKFNALTIGPAGEELMFRCIPSFVVDEVIEGGDTQDSMDTLAHGTDYLGITRNELIVGAISSLLFGAVHNITDKGINTEILPTTQVLGGVLYWALQRRLGTLANLSAHVTNNVLNL